MFKHILILQLMTFVFASFEKDCLDSHNKYRALHSAEPLTLDPKLQSVAQNYANYLAANQIFRHSKNGYGENLFAMYGRNNVKAETAVHSWYKEIDLYNFNNPGFSKGTGHFTQLVWKGSKKLGCAAAVVGNNVYIVANYYPAGNYIGRFRKNVSQF